jgi:hypothetical protein
MRYISALQRSHAILSSLFAGVALVASGVIGFGNGGRAGSDMQEL